MLIFVKENSFEKAVCRMSAISLRPLCVTPCLPAVHSAMMWPIIRLPAAENSGFQPSWLPWTHCCVLQLNHSVPPLAFHKVICYSTSPWLWLRDTFFFREPLVSAVTCLFCDLVPARPFFKGYCWGWVGVDFQHGMTEDILRSMHPDPLLIRR